MNSNDALPFLKWAGGKRQLLNQFEELYPQKLKDGFITTYIEPFVGGGAVFFDLQKKYKFQKVLLNDINEDLILAYKVIQSNCSELLISLKRLEEKYINLQSIELQSIMFYEIRNIFNKEKKSMDYSVLDSAWISHASNLIFLNKTCFNGLYRLNKSGDFNVPFGKYKNPTICNSENLLNVSAALQNVILTHGEYKDIEKYIDINEDTFVYIDPPYRPLTNSSSFTSYSKSGFNDENQVELSVWFKKLVKKNHANVMLSNSDPDDDFFYNLYENNEDKIKIKKVSASRAINSNASKRGKISEIVVIHE